MQEMDLNCAVMLFYNYRVLKQGAHAIKLLYDVADELDEWHYNSSIVKVAAGSAGIGGAMAGTHACMHGGV